MPRIEFWSPFDAHGRVKCQTRERDGGGQCLRYQDHGGGHVYPKVKVVEQPARFIPAAEYIARRSKDGS